jgi:formamidopyrimidine-DNA glycosylase
MPELPEVQTTVNDLITAGLLRRKIESVYVGWHKTILPLSEKDFSACVSGKTILSLRRRAKYIVMELKSSGNLLIHLRMTGRFELSSGGTERDKHHHAIFVLDDSRELRFHDTRKFGRITYTEDPDSVLKKLGPEPLSKEFTVEIFQTMLKRHSRMIKPLLLDQSFLAGLGNIYTDEALYLAHIHPMTIANQISNRQSGELYNTIRAVLSDGIDNRGTSLGEGETNYASGGKRGDNRNSLKVFRRTGLPCPSCRAIIKRIVVGQRSTHICPECQKITALTS